MKTFGNYLRIESAAVEASSTVKKLASETSSSLRACVSDEEDCVTRHNAGLLRAHDNARIRTRREEWEKRKAEGKQAGQQRRIAAARSRPDGQPQEGNGRGLLEVIGHRHDGGVIGVAAYQRAVGQRIVEPLV